jgi:hypothetical protein
MRGLAWPKLPPCGRKEIDTAVRAVARHEHGCRLVGLRLRFGCQPVSFGLEQSSSSGGPGGSPKQLGMAVAHAMRALVGGRRRRGAPASRFSLVYRLFLRHLSARAPGRPRLRASAPGGGLIVIVASAWLVE